ncbi:hypothetical protein ACWF76_01750 [Streptomyces globisporus]
MCDRRRPREARLSRDGFSEQELDIMERLRQVQVETDVKAEAAELSTPNSAAEAPRSRLDDL